MSTIHTNIFYTSVILHINLTMCLLCYMTFAVLVRCIKPTKTNNYMNYGVMKLVQFFVRVTIRFQALNF